MAKLSVTLTMKKRFFYYPLICCMAIAVFFGMDSDNAARIVVDYGMKFNAA